MPFFLLESLGYAQLYYRSYLYAADLAIWLWTILMRGKTCRPYNVGSENEITIAELAHQVADCFQPAPRVEIIVCRPLSVVRCPSHTPKSGQLPERYVPFVQRCARELDLRQTIDLREAIRRTIAFLQAQS